MSVASVMQSACSRPGVIWKLFAPPPRAPSGAVGRLLESHCRIDASSNSFGFGAASGCGAAGLSAWGCANSTADTDGIIAGAAAGNGGGGAAVILPTTIGTENAN